MINNISSICYLFTLWYPSRCLSFGVSRQPFNRARSTRLIADRVEGREGVPYFPRSKFWQITLEIKNTLLFICRIDKYSVTSKKVNTNANINDPPDFVSFSGYQLYTVFCAIWTAFFQVNRVEHQKLNQTTPYGAVWLSFWCSTRPSADGRH